MRHCIAACIACCRTVKILLHSMDLVLGVVLMSPACSCLPQQGMYDRSFALLNNNLLPLLLFSCMCSLHAHRDLHNSSIPDRPCHPFDSPPFLSASMCVRLLPLNLQLSAWQTDASCCAVQVRDAKVSISDSHEGLLVHNLQIHKSKGKSKKAEADPNAPKESAQRLQFVVAFDMADWEEWKAYFRPQDCLMQHRSPRQEGGGPSNAAGRPRGQVRADSKQP